MIEEDFFVRHVILIIFIPINVGLEKCSGSKKNNNNNNNVTAHIFMKPKEEEMPVSKWHQPEDNNNITIYNRVTICEWQSGIIAHVTFIVLLPAGAGC